MDDDDALVCVLPEKLSKFFLQQTIVLKFNRGSRLDVEIMRRALRLGFERRTILTSATV